MADPREGVGQLGVARARAQQRPQVATEQPAACAHPAAFVRQVSGGDGPRGVDVASYPAMEAPGRVSCSAGEHEGQLLRFQRGDRHAVPVDGIEGAQRVPGDEETLREAIQPLVASSAIGREPVGDRFVERGHGVQRIGQRGVGERTCVALPLGGLDGGTGPEHPHQADHVLTALDLQHDAAPGQAGPGSDRHRRGGVGTGRRTCGSRSACRRDVPPLPAPGSRGSPATPVCVRPDPWHPPRGRRRGQRSRRRLGPGPPRRRRAWRHGRSAGRGPRRPREARRPARPAGAAGASTPAAACSP